MFNRRKAVQANACTHSVHIKWRNRQKQQQKGRPQEPAADNTQPVCMRVCTHSPLACMCAHRSKWACRCLFVSERGEGGREGMSRKRSKVCVCVMESCESELLSMINSACLSVRSVQAEKIGTCRSYWDASGSTGEGERRREKKRSGRNGSKMWRRKKKEGEDRRRRSSGKQPRHLFNLSFISLSLLLSLHQISIRKM